MLRAVLLTLAALATAAAPARAQEAVPDYVASENLQLVKRIKEAGDVAGGKVVGSHLFVTSSTHLSIWDISEAENPTLEGVFTVDIEWENEEVPTNGKILGISGSTGCVPLLSPADSNTNCLNLYDVSEPASTKFLSSVSGAGDHTQACVYECTWFYGSEGTIVDARDPRAASVAGNWIELLGETAEGISSSCHHVREVAPGLLLGTCQPILLISVRAEHGGSPLKPVVLASGGNEDGRFIHSTRWPQEGRDRFMLAGGETFIQPSCSDSVAAFMTWDARSVLAPGGGWNPGATFTLIDEQRPDSGTYADGRSPYFVFGCSVHWFEEHPTFSNGGIVALAEFENGTRIKQVTPDGKIVEQGYIVPAGGVAGAPHWHPNGKVFYSTDYQRGIDVVRYTGDTYVPDAGGNVTPTPGAAPGTGGVVPPASGGSARPAGEGAGSRSPASGPGVGRFALKAKFARVPGRRGRRVSLRIEVRDLRDRVVARLRSRRAAGRRATVAVSGLAVAGPYRYTVSAGRRKLTSGRVRVRPRDGLTLPRGTIARLRAR